MVCVTTRSWIAALAVCALLVHLGCIPTDDTHVEGTPDDTSEQVASGTPVSQHAEAEPNNEYTSAEVLIINDAITLSGAINPSSGELDRDIFELGPVAVGDRIIGTLNRASGGDVVMGLLDAEGRLLAFVDPNSSTAGPSSIDITVHEASNRLYVVVSTRASLNSDQPYDAQIEIERATGLGPFRPQAVVLDFEGASSVRIGSRAAVNVPTFDAGELNANYAGQTEELIELLVSMVRDDYEGLNIDVYRSGDADIPSDNVSYVYFGTYDENLLGLADNIDPFNEDRVQAAIVYTDTFKLFNALNPSIEEMAQVLANVTSHEIGHLVGLRHTSDPAGIMDVTASARQMMADQSFTTSTLYTRVLSVGVQDSPAMLSWTLGGSLPTSSFEKFAQRQRIMAVAGRDDDFYLPARMRGSACGMDHDHEAE